MRGAIPLAAALLFAVGLGCEDGPKYDKDGNLVTKGTFRVRTYPAGAKVWVNGKLEAISTPATLVLEAGEYHLEMQLEGAEPYEADITVEAGEAGERRYRIPKPPPATITVLSDVAGADVRINGYRRGATPVHDAVTKPGPIDITISTPDGRARSVKGHLKVAEQKRVQVRFAETGSTSVTVSSESALEAPAPAKAPPAKAPPAKAPPAKPDAGAPRGLLTLGLQPNGVVFTADGEPLGETPIVKKPMEPGRYDLLLRAADGSKERRVRLVVEPGQHAVYRFMLKARDEVPEARRVPAKIAPAPPEPEPED